MTAIVSDPYGHSFEDSLLAENMVKVIKLAAASVETETVGMVLIHASWRDSKDQLVDINCIVNPDPDIIPAAQMVILTEPNYHYLKE